MRMLPIALVMLALGACAGSPKMPAGGPVEGAPTVAEARSAPEGKVGARVRWGGTVLSVQNLADATMIEVLARRLEDDGRPIEGSPSDGRFWIRVPGFADPAVLTEGREVTVTGTLAEPQIRRIGEHDYRYPVVDAERWHLWAPRPERSERDRYRYADPWFYDPFYDPFYPWPYYRPWPYYW